MGFVGGHGIFSKNDIVVAELVSLHMKQIINTAELLAALEALRLHADEPKVAICADSELCPHGGQGVARRWQARGWVGSSGPVFNVSLSLELLEFLDSTFQDIVWKKIPSQVNVEGNE